MERERLVRKIAAYVYAQAVLNQGDNNVCVYFDEILNDLDYVAKDAFNDIEFVKDIQNEISGYPGCDGNPDACWIQMDGYDEYGDVSKTSDTHNQNGFNLCLFTDYIAYDEEDE